MSDRKKPERAKVDYAKFRAKEFGLPATLTVEQWLETLNFFGFSCAYCGGPYEVLEHFIPLKRGGEGTTVINCFPACVHCNRKKGTIDPYDYVDLLAHLFDHARLEKVVQHIQAKHFLVHPEEELGRDCDLTGVPVWINNEWQYRAKS